MKVDTHSNRAALAGEAEVNAACRNQLSDYLARTGLSVPDFAHRINYSPVTVRFFLGDRYHNVGRSARTLVKSIEDFISTHPAGTAALVRGDIYDTANVRKIRATFAELLPQPMAEMIYAPPGSQKSFVLEHQVAELNRLELANPQGRRAFYVYARIRIRPRDLIKRIAIACGCRVSSDIESMLTSISFDFRHNRVLLVVDEAQHLDLDCFETVRELLDRPPYFSLLLSGSHDLRKKFDEISPTWEQWNSRVNKKVCLPGLERAEAVGIIEREIGEELNARRTPHEAEMLINDLIKGATVHDHFDKNRTYINVRTLTNALTRIKAVAKVQRARTA